MKRCHSERSEESVVMAAIGLGLQQIPRCARDDTIKCLRTTLGRCTHGCCRLLLLTHRLYLRQFVAADELRIAPHVRHSRKGLAVVITRVPEQKPEAAILI